MHRSTLKRRSTPNAREHPKAQEHPKRGSIQSAGAPQCAGALQCAGAFQNASLFEFLMLASLAVLLLLQVLLLLASLQVPQRAVLAARRGKQLLVVAALDNLALVEHNNLVHVDDRGEPMRYKAKNKRASWLRSRCNVVIAMGAFDMTRGVREEAEAMT